MTILKCGLNAKATHYIFYRFTSKDFSSKVTNLPESNTVNAYFYNYLLNQLITNLSMAFQIGVYLHSTYSVF